MPSGGAGAAGASATPPAGATVGSFSFSFVLRLLLDQFVAVDAAALSPVSTRYKRAILAALLFLRDRDEVTGAELAFVVLLAGVRARALLALPGVEGRAIEVLNRHAGLASLAFPPAPSSSSPHAVSSAGADGPAVPSAGPFLASLLAEPSASSPALPGAGTSAPLAEPPAMRASPDLLSPGMLPGEPSPGNNSPSGVLSPGALAPEVKAAIRRAAVNLAAGGASGVLDYLEQSSGSAQGALTQLALGALARRLEQQRRAEVLRLHEVDGAPPPDTRPFADDPVGMGAASAYAPMLATDFRPADVCGRCACGAPPGDPSFAAGSCPSGCSCHAQQPWASGEAIIRLHAPYCADCSAGRPCYIVTLAQQVERRTPNFAPDAPPPDMPGRHAGYVWKDEDLAECFAILDAKYISRAVIEQISAEQAASSMGHPVFLAKKLQVKLAGVPTDLEGFLAWVNGQAAAAVARVEAHRQAGLARSGGKDWATGVTAFANLIFGETAELKSRFVFDGSVGINVHQQDWAFRLVSLTEVISHLTPGCYIAVRDIAGGFFHVKLDADAVKYFAFSLPPRPGAPPGAARTDFAFSTDPFGDKTAPGAFCWLSGFAVWLVRKRLAEARVGGFVTCYVDDFIFVFASKADCDTAVRFFEDVCRELRLVIANAKSQGPAQCVVALGFQLDSAAGTITLPQDKLAARMIEVGALSALVERRVSVPLRWLRAVVARLQHVTCILPGSAAYLSRLYVALSVLPHPHFADVSPRGNPMVALHSVEGVLDELQWWGRRLTALARSPAPLFFTSMQGVARAASGEPGLASRSDAAGGDAGVEGDGGGFGLLMGPVSIWGRFRGEDAARSIGYKEMFPIVLLLQIYGLLLYGQAVTTLTDNLPNVSAIAKWRTRSDVDALLKRLADLTFFFTCALVAFWLPREENVDADGQSKGASIAEARVAFPHTADLSDVSPFRRSPLEVDLLGEPRLLDALLDAQRGALLAWATQRAAPASATGAA